MGRSVKRFGILTSGGDCPGLNAAIRAVGKCAIGGYGMEIMGIQNGFRGLVEGDIIKMDPRDFSGILTIGGTILGTSRYKPLKPPKGTDLDINEENLEKIRSNIEKFKLDCVVVLGGNGSHKTTNLLNEYGLPVLGLPKTIDNDVYGTDVTIGFHSAVSIATQAIDRLHSTAHSHNRVMILEVMGHDAGWLALYSGTAGGGDVIILPEIPYRVESIAKHLKERADGGKDFSIVVVAEGARSVSEKGLSGKKLRKKRKKKKSPTVAYMLAKNISKQIDMDVRVSVLGYQQRGGAPNPYDRLIATTLGTAAAEFLNAGELGKLVVICNGEVKGIPLEQTAGKLKLVPACHPLIEDAKRVGTCFGDGPAEAEFSDGDEV